MNVAINGQAQTVSRQGTRPNIVLIRGRREKPGVHGFHALARKRVGVVDLLAALAVRLQIRPLRAFIRPSIG